MSDDRPTLKELASRSAHDVPVSVIGKPAETCPYCGGVLFAYGTSKLTETTERYVECRSSQCAGKSGRGPAFLTRQPPPIIIREVDRRDKDSISGIVQLTLHRDSA